MPLSFLAIMNTPRRAVADMQRQLMDRQREASTGRKADVGLSLGGRTHQAVSLRYDFDINSTQIDANRLTSGQLDLTQNILSSVSELAHQFTSTLIGSRNAVNGQQLIKQAAEQALSGLTALLNTTHDGQFLFGGINNGAKPVADYDSVPASAAKSAIDADFLAQFGFSQSSASVTSITTAQMDAFTAGAFGNEFSSASWADNWSAASNENRTARADQGQVLEIPVNANLQPIRDMAMALTMMIDLGTANLSQGTFQSLVDKSTALTAKSAGAIGEVQALVGNVQYQISAATERLISRNNILQKEINSLEGVDPYEAATRVNTLTNQLEASYALTARLSRLSLMDYI